MAEYIEEFRNRLEEALQLRDMKPVELSKRTGCSEAKISQYRSGYAKSPKRDTIMSFADALQVDPAWLTGYDVPMFPPKKHHGESGVMAERFSLYMQEIESLAGQLDEENLKRLATYAEKLFAVQKAEEELS